MYKSCIRELWAVNYDVGIFFPEPIADWVRYKATILGVPHSYVAWPLMISTAYTSQHSFVTAGKGIHVEPIILYGLVGGRSGKNKFTLKLFL